MVGCMSNQHSGTVRGWGGAWGELVLHVGKMQWVLGAMAVHVSRPSNLWSPEVERRGWCVGVKSGEMRRFRGSMKTDSDNSRELWSCEEERKTDWDNFQKMGTGM